MTNTDRRRFLRNILVAPGLQVKITFFIVLAGIICTALNSYLYYTYVVDSYDFILRYSTMPQELVYERYRDLYQFGLALFFITLALILIIAVWALALAHRTAGSVYRIKRVIGEIKAGNIKERIHLRDKDEFQDVAELFNQMMDDLQKAEPPLRSHPVT